ncbi:MAG: type IV pilin N-terminal domain-containing protein, partial [Candidatus Thermoplasmatota archaeon]|nr:type IV pilin N-terminal domain-containing protein [Candidatus Thermoplasmatota archaeon]
ANRKFIEADERAVSAVIGVILMVAITVAIAATVYVYVSGMIGGTKNQTPNVACTTDSTTDRITIATADANILWRDVTITLDQAGATFRVYYANGNPVDLVNATSGAGTAQISAGDYVLMTTHTGNVKATLKYIPTNSLLGSWTVNV